MRPRSVERGKPRVGDAGNLADLWGVLRAVDAKTGFDRGKIASRDPFESVICRTASGCREFVTAEPLAPGVYHDSEPGWPYYRVTKTG